MPFPPPGDLPDLGIEPTSPMSPALQADSLPTEPSGKPRIRQIQRDQPKHRRPGFSCPSSACLREVGLGPRWGPESPPTSRCGFAFLGFIPLIPTGEHVQRRLEHVSTGGPVCQSLVLRESRMLGLGRTAQPRCTLA